MEMRVLSELSRWVLSQSSLKESWGELSWREAFEACGSPTEWDQYRQGRADDLVVRSLVEASERIAAEVLVSRQSRPRTAVVLPDF